MNSWGKKVNYKNKNVQLGALVNKVEKYLSKMFLLLEREFQIDSGFFLKITPINKVKVDLFRLSHESYKFDYME